MSTVYLNGRYLPVEEAKISVMDRGFLFGDGVYEVIPVYGGHLLRIDEHMRRLDNSLAGISMDNPMSHAEWISILEKLVAENEGADKSVYLHVSRGEAPVRDHAFPASPNPTVFIMTSVLKTIPRETLEKGVAAVTLDDIRWRACNIKATALLANALLRQQAVAQGCAEAILIRDGNVTEGAASNVFIVNDGVIRTPPLGPYLLPGITRDLVIDLACEYDLRHEVADVSESQLVDADEIWLTSSTKEILPVVTLNGEPVANGQVGPIWKRMIDIYQDYKARFRQGEGL